MHTCYMNGHPQNGKGCNNKSICFRKCAICTNITSITTLYQQKDKIFIMALVNFLTISREFNYESPHIISPDIKCLRHTRMHTCYYGYSQQQKVTIFNIVLNVCHIYTLYQWLSTNKKRTLTYQEQNNNQLSSKRM